MKLIGRLIDIFRDSPTYGRDRANLISGFSIGTAGLLLNAAVMLMVLPFLIAPDDRDFRAINENLEFGQLLSLILLVGAAAFATLLIPLRMVTVFWGPRIGRYFDQVVLSGISPLRFIIGKATSQNLFLGLILFLLLPYLVLSVTFGGADVSSFLAGLFLLWLYCMALALVTLWLSLYFNELIAALLVIAGASFLGGLGCIPIPFQPFVMTPMPVLLYPMFDSVPFLDGQIPASVLPLFLSCAGCLTGIICISLFAIALGPLFGIIRENSTFGEVVRAGDGKRKRWFRLRLHIQRPSEIAFLYENRGDTFRRHEGLIRWGTGFGVLLLLLAASYAVTGYVWWKFGFRGGATPPSQWWVYDFHMAYLIIHGCCLVLGVFLFSHARNTTFQKVAFFRGRLVEVSRLDTYAFLLLALLSTAASLAAPFVFERLVAVPSGTTAFPALMYGNQGRPLDYFRVAVEGTLSLTLAGLVVYALHRYACLIAWLKSGAFVGVAALYFVLICMLPILFMGLFFYVPELRNSPTVKFWATRIAMASPFTLMGFLFNELGGQFPRSVPSFPFYLSHLTVLGAAIMAIRRLSEKVRDMYLNGNVRRPGR